MDPRTTLQLRSLAAVRERRRQRKESRGDSPEKQAERHVPKFDIVDAIDKQEDAMRKLAGVDFKSRYPER